MCRGILDGVVFTGDASDGDIDPYHGWLIGYDAKTLKLVTFFNSTPNGDFGGIWQSGGAPSVLPNGDLLLGTGNGTFDDFTTTTPPGAAAQGEGGFGLGSSGLGQSAAVSFAASIPSSGVSSTGLFFNGDTPTDQPLRPTSTSRWPGPASTSRRGPRTPTARTPSRRPSRTAAPRSPRRSPTRPPAPPSAATTRT